MTTYRDIPSVDRLVQAVQQQIGDTSFPHTIIVQAVRAELDAVRAKIKEQNGAPSNGKDGAQALCESSPSLIPQLVAAVQTRLDKLTLPSLQPVVNATGVIIQTNLGRAPLSVAALAAMHMVGGGYSNLEYDLDQGERGSRNSHLNTLLQQLTGAAAALVVNNNAAAVYLALIALAAGREVIVSRGQAVEIGGGFRIPDVLRQSGASLVEVGTTNRTYARDYAAAINERTALLLRVHTSNFRLMGFVHETSLADMVAVGHAQNVPVLDDLGSGTLLSTQVYGLAPEPTVQESIAAGADLVTFSGDKLLGGPQAGIIVGRADLIDQLKRHPLARALRVDKTTIAGLHATLLAYLQGRATAEIPVWRMIAAPLEQLRIRAQALAARFGSAASVVPCQSAIGGGSLPGETLSSVAIALSAGKAIQPLDNLARALRVGSPPIVARIADDCLLFDLRTVLPEQDDILVERISAMLHPS
ncbi:MAG: L-seryl-tRNA(Sec) selenium transferase [Chloroflexales bacterium]|nr:L-seryl-tRNA(Sec) selenium transferase [Chloroflexales bacterium]